MLFSRLLCFPLYIALRSCTTRKLFNLACKLRCSLNKILCNWQIYGVMRDALPPPAAVLWLMVTQRIDDCLAAGGGSDWQNTPSWRFCERIRLRISPTRDSSCRVFTVPAVARSRRAGGMTWRVLRHAVCMYAAAGDSDSDSDCVASGWQALHASTTGGVSTLRAPSSASVRPASRAPGKGWP